MLKLILIRHAETIWNEELRYIGSTDLELSELGRKNASLAADYLASEKIDAIFSSDLRRAVETAAAIAAPHELPVTTLPELREIDFGDWEGLTHTEISQKYEDLIGEWLADPLAAVIPAGEKWPDFERRVTGGLQKVIDSLANGTAAVITHGGPIKAIIGSILKIPPSSYWQIYQDKGAINVIGYDENRARLVLMNDTCYRKPMFGLNS